MEIFIKISQFILSLSLIIVLHEFGHYWPAKYFKIKVEKFYLFFDVNFSLFKKKIGETDCDDEKFNTSADNLFSANSNDNFVLVEFSKKRLAIVISLKDGTFLIGLFITSLKLSAVSKINSKSSRFKNFIPNK